MANSLKWYQKHFLWRRLRINRRYKDRLFRFLFRDKKDLLELYNAINGSAYSNADDLEIVTLEDAIFMKMKNDLSFIIANQLNLYEHQSTYSPNMPLRGLLYFSRQYEGIVAQHKDQLYSSKLIKLPTPEYVIFYNGKQEQADREELFLSDAFETGQGSGCLECKAVLFNINRGHNQELLEKCRRLWEYSEFISEVSENLDRNISLKAAIMKAVDSCIQKGILEELLRKNQAEVLHMLLTEYDEKAHMRGIYKEGEEAGYQKGKLEGYSKGEEDGYAKGERDGYRKGESDLLVKLVRQKLERGKSIPVIAEELETEAAVIEEIGERIKNMAKSQ